MSSKPFFELSENLIKKYCDLKTFCRGEGYIDAVSTLILRGEELCVRVYGSMEEPYRVNITFNEKNWKRGSCSCPSDNYPCKHIVATLLKIAREGLEFIEPAFKESLQSMDAEALRALLLNIIAENPELMDDIQLAQIQPQQKNEIPSNFLALKRKMLKTLNSDFNNWDDSFSYIIEDVKTLFTRVQPFLDAEDGMTALKVLEALTEPLFTEDSEFLEYAGDSFSDLLDDLEPLWIEAFLIAQLSKAESEYWFERISDWKKDEDWAFQALMQVIQHGWDHPVLEAALKCQKMIKNNEESDDEINKLIASIGLKILKRKHQLDQCLALTKLVCMDQEHASILIQQRKFQESQKYIKQTFKSPETILKLARQFNQLEQSQIAFELIVDALSHMDDSRNVNLELIRWSRKLAFELNQVDTGIQIGTKILQQNPTLEDYESLKVGAKEKWKNIQPKLLQSIQTAPEYRLSGPIEILLHEKMFDSAIQLSEQADRAFFPEFIIDRILGERPDWAMKKCEELAIASINSSTNYGYETATKLLEKGYEAARLTRKSGLWNTKIQQIISDNKRKRNLIPLLQHLLSAYS